MADEYGKWLKRALDMLEASPLVGTIPAAALARTELANLLRVREAAQAYMEFAKDVAVSPSAPDLKAIRDELRAALAAIQEATTDATKG